MGLHRIQINSRDSRLGAGTGAAGLRHPDFAGNQAVIPNQASFGEALPIHRGMGADPESRIYYNRVKGETEAAIRQTAFRVIHIFRPSLLLGERSEKRPGERIGAALLRALSPLLLGPLRKYRAVPAAAVARAMLRAAEDDGGGTRVHLSDEIARSVAK